jgi:hypothetical protein
MKRMKLMKEEHLDFFMFFMAFMVEGHAKPQRI